MAEQETQDVQSGADSPTSSRPFAGAGTDETAGQTEAQLAQLRAERDEAIARAREHEEAARYWHSVAKGPAASETAKPEDTADDDVLSIATQGGKAMQAWLKKQGFVSREEAERIAKQHADQRIAEAQLVAQYEDLANPKSEFFKETAALYGQLKTQGVPPEVAMRLAAEQVDLRRKAKAEPSARGSEEERAARAAAQGAPGKRGAAAKTESEDLTPEQERIAEAMGISPEAYKKRAKEGVQIGRW
jgi:hypothetical protein